MSRAVQIAAACLALVALVLFLLKRRPPRLETRGWRTRVVASLRVGGGPDSVAAYQGVDGSTYGPLAFLVAGHRIAVLDSARSEVLIGDVRARSPSRWERVHIPDGMLEALAWDPKAHAWLVADNRHLVVWAIRGTRPVPLIRLAQRDGYTGAVETMAVGPGGQIFVAWVSAGQGTVAARLCEYRGNGTLIRQHMDTLTRDGIGPGAAARKIVLLALAGLAVGPDGRLYVLSPGAGATGPQVLIVNSLSLHVEARIALPANRRLALLGLAPDGTVYLTEPAGRSSGLVVAYDRTGTLVGRVGLPPQTLHLGRAAYLTPGGVLYLAETGRGDYRIVVVTRR